MLELPHGSIELPAFLPDATRGVVREVDSDDLERCGVQALVMNTFHLMQRPGSSTVRALGGLHQMSGWTRPIITDSGGFQAYSVVRNDPKRSSLDDDGIRVRPEGSGRTFRLTPEKSVQLQLSYGSDVVICLDDCTHPDDPPERQALSVKRTIDWARRSKQTFDRLVDEKGLGADSRPLLFGVIQGGTSRDLREQCANELLPLDFDGFGYGGWPLDAENRLLTETLATTAELLPDDTPLHALGVGHPANVAACAALGYRLFDSAMPTRDARRGRLYRFTQDPATLAPDPEGEWLDFCYVGDDKHTKAYGPVSEHCDAICCTRYSLAYLHHLHRIKEGLFPRLATLHNLRFMMQLMSRLRDSARGV